MLVFSSSACGCLVSLDLGGYCGEVVLPTPLLLRGRGGDILVTMLLILRRTGGEVLIAVLLILRWTGGEDFTVVPCLSSGLKRKC